MKIKFVKDSKAFKKGEILDFKDDEAKVIIEEGYAVEHKDTKELRKKLKRIKDNQEALGRNAIIRDEEVHLVNKEEKRKYELMKLLKKKDIFNRITEKELDKKIVREIKTRKVIFLCACGRFVKNNQIASYNLLVNDEAGTGKDYVTSKTLEILPFGHLEKRTRISSTVFTYWHRWDEDWTWDGKVCYLEDVSDSIVNSEVFKVMCSSGSNATVVIKQKAVDIEIKGKPVIIITSANAIPRPELTRRFEFVQLDESIDQTIEIKKRQAEYAEKGVNPEYKIEYKKAMRLLKRVKVRIPYARKLPSLFPDDNIVMRTKFQRFLDFIKACTAFHQYQRRTDKNGFLLSNEQDYNIASLCFSKLCTNPLMISLTRNQRKITDFFKKNPSFCENVAKINEKLHNFISIPALKTNLSILTKYGFLISLIDSDSLNRDIEKFKLNNLIDGEVRFPTFKELDSKVSKVIKDNKEDKDIKVLKKGLKKDKKRIESGI